MINFVHTCLKLVWHDDSLADDGIIQLILIIANCDSSNIFSMSFQLAAYTRINMNLLAYT